MIDPPTQDFKIYLHPKTFTKYFNILVWETRELWIVLSKRKIGISSFCGLSHCRSQRPRPTGLRMIDPPFWNLKIYIVFRMLTKYYNILVWGTREMSVAAPNGETMIWRFSRFLCVVSLLNHDDQTHQIEDDRSTVLELQNSHSFPNAYEILQHSGVGN